MFSKPSFCLSTCFSHLLQPHCQDLEYDNDEEDPRPCPVASDPYNNDQEGSVMTWVSLSQLVTTSDQSVYNAFVGLVGHSAFCRDSQHRGGIEHPQRRHVHCANYIRSRAAGKAARHGCRQASFPQKRDCG